jgi:GLPGLI family protein
MKNYLHIIILPLLTYCPAKHLLHAQQPSALGSITYQFHHVTDTTNPNHAWNEKMNLTFYDNKSLYTSYSKREQAELITQATEQASANGNNVVTMKAFGPITIENIYTYLQTNERYLEEHYHSNRYIIKETLPIIHWQIKQETKMI